MSLATSVQLLTLLLNLCAPQRTADQSELTFFATPNPVFVNEAVTMKCEFGPGLSLLSAELRAYSGQESKGYLKYTYPNGGIFNGTITGMVNRRNTESCSAVGSTSFCSTFDANQAQNIEIFCSAILLNTTNLEIVALYSKLLSLVILGSPGRLSISYFPYYSYTEGSNVTLSCSSSSASSPTNLVLDVTSSLSNETLNYATGLNFVSVSWIMSQSYHQAVATCRLTNHAYVYLRTTPAVTRCIWIRGSTLLTFSNNPAYTGEKVTISCHVPYIYVAYSCVVSIEAFSSTEKKGSSTFRLNYGQRNTSGIFLTSQSDVAYDWNWDSMIVSESLVASSQMEMDYYCTAANCYSSEQLVGTTPANRFTVYTSPSPLSFIPPNLAFLDGESVNITCYTYYGGNPLAKLRIVVNSSKLLEAGLSDEGFASASVAFTASPKWHHANVTCGVLNHNRKSMNVADIIKVVHLTIIGSPNVAYTYDNDTILSCASYVSGFPEPTFQWTTPTQLNVSDAYALNKPNFIVLRRQAGLFNCTAKNEITGKTVTVFFTVTDVAPETNVSSYGAIVGGVVGSLIGIAATFGIIAIILRQRSNQLNIRSFLSWLKIKQPDVPVTHGNDYSQTPPGSLAAACEDTADNVTSWQHEYGNLGDIRENAETTYSTLDMAFQNSAYSEK